MPATGLADQLLDELAGLAERRHRDPGGILARAGELLVASDDPRVQACAHWVAALALHELGQAADAVAAYRRSIELCTRHRLGSPEAPARAGLAHSLLSVGDRAGADREMATARQVAAPDERGVVEMLHGVLLNRTGRLDQALTTYRRALRSLEQAGDLPSIARLRLNRGILHAYQGDLAGALDDLGESERIAEGRDLPVLAAMAAHNTGFAQGRLGNVPDALAAFDRAERAYAVLERPGRLPGVLQADRCEVLLLAGLLVEARAAAAASVAAMEAAGEAAHLPECRLLLARAMLAQHAYADAAAQATLAARQFAATRRLPWAALSRYVAIQAEALSSEDERVPPPDMLRRSRRIAVELETHGWPVEAVHVRTFIGRMALAAGRPAVARTELARAAEARARGTADLRAGAWHATALLRLAEGDRSGAKRALTRGMAVVDEYCATLGATELRASAAGHGAELARLGIRLALLDGRPAPVLHWAERWRAGALRHPAVRPPDDEELAADLAELRRLRTELRDTDSDGAGARDLWARAGALEEAVRARTLQSSAGRAAATGRIDLPVLRRALGDRALVEYVTLEGDLHAVTVTRAGTRLHALGPAAAVEQEKQYLLFTLRRLLSGRSPAAAADALALTADRLDDLLLAPLGLPAGVPLVVVPTGVLHGLPWACLPGSAGHSITVAPSAAVWHDDRHGRGAAGRVPAAGTRVTLVAGPQLPGAEAEVRELAALYGDAEVLAGADATAANVLAAFERSDVVHLAAHGFFRADSPLFSSVLLGDGPLTVYDLERVRAAPALVVLSACDAAAAVVHSGDDLLGTATALLGLGVRSVVAPVLAVPDEATVGFMVAFHRRLRAGDRVAAALAGASGGSHRGAAAAFVCIGRDEEPTNRTAGGLFRPEMVAPENVEVYEGEGAG